jgi:Uma2 family endonuclease
MVANPQREPRYTVEEYFELESKSELRHEYIDGEIWTLEGGQRRRFVGAIPTHDPRIDIYAMAGESRAHGTIFGNLFLLVGTEVRLRGCRAFSGDMRVKVSVTRYLYPDISVICGDAVFEKHLGLDMLTNPRLVIEILSPTTEVYDRSGKFAAYQAVASLQEYVLISQDKPLIERYLRQPNDEWLYTGARGLAAALELRSVGCVLALADVYADVEFAGEGSDAASADVEFAGEGSDAASADVEFDDQTEEA